MGRDVVADDTGIRAGVMAMAVHALVHVDRFAITVRGWGGSVVGRDSMNGCVIRRFVCADQGVGHRNTHKRDRGECNAHQPNQALEG